jgi:alpha-galactosidase
MKLRALFTKSVPCFLVFSTVIGWGQTSGLTSRDLWKADHVPFSFKYDGKESAQLLPTWQTSHEEIADGTTRYSYVDPKTQLKVTAEVRYYRDFPGAVDWVIRYRNDGSSDTPIIEDILPLHWSIAAAAGDCILRHAQGSEASARDFQPLEERFGPSDSDYLESRIGKSSSRYTLPFFNLQTGDHGLIGAVGWTGNWKADFFYAGDGKTISMKAGMKRTHLVLHPGEEIRTPRIVLMNWSGGNWEDSQNLWRHLLLAHYSPQDNGKAMVGPIMFGSWGSEDIDRKIAYIEWVHAHKIPLELYAVDAGWYGASFGAENDPTNPWWKNRGDWFPSPRYYPHGIRPLGEALKAAGFGFSLWIEPETSMPNRKIINDHPDWYLQSDMPVNPGVALANLGDPVVRKGLTDMVSGFITDFEMTWYRQDFNIPPERYWELADKPDRIGMTEIGHIEGLYKMWDDLLARHLGLHIDNCASGGQRIDIEMMLRSFVIWRTDHGFVDTLAEQAQTQALAPWVPQNMGFESYTQGKPWKTSGPYSTPKSLYLMRLGYDAGYGTNPGETGVDNDAWVSWYKQAIAEYQQVRPYFYGDFYPLLPYSRQADVWTAWQWDRPENNDGIVLVLRRPKSSVTNMQFDLKHLQGDASYEVEIRSSYDRGPVKEMKGSELAHLRIAIAEAPGSVLVLYRRR